MVKNIVLVTNEINPYRKSFYDRLYTYCKSLNIRFTVLLMTKVEQGYNWNYEKVKSEYAILMKGIHFSFPINNYLNSSVVKILRELNPDIVIMAGSYFYYTNWLVIANKKRHHYPIYFWSETHFQEKRTYGSLTLKIREKIRHILYQKFDGFWYSGKLSKEFIEYYASNGAKYHFVPNLIDYQNYYTTTQRLRQKLVPLRRKWEIPENNKVIITPARLSWVKGIHTFIDLLEQIPQSQDITMLIPGTGTYKHEIEKKIKASKLDIRLLGYQQQDTMMELYAVADYFVLPSLSDPNPLTCIEALWCGLPLLVSTHVGNYPEVIQNGKNGYVFDYANRQEAIHIITQFLSSSEEWRQNASQYSLEIANKYYNPETVVSRLINDLIKENNSQGFNDTFKS